MEKAVWVITGTYQVQAFYMREEKVAEFIEKCKARGKEIYKVTDRQY